MSVEEDTELRDLVAQTLETNGVLNKIRAELRANVFLALEEQDSLQKKNVSNKALQNFLETPDGHQAFSLVREFLQFFNLDFTLAVFDPESDYTNKASSRENLIKDLSLHSVSPHAPLLTQIIKGKSERISSPTSSPKHSKIPQRVTQSSKNQDNIINNKKSLDNDDLDNEDDLLKELGVSPISYNTTNNKGSKNTKPSWLEPSSKFSTKKSDDGVSSKINGLGSLKDAPPLHGVSGKLMESPLDSPEWDDVMKIDKKIGDLGFEIPKEDSSYSLKGKKTSLKDSDYNYEDDFNTSSSPKSDGLSITEEIEDKLSIGSFADSKGDDILTTDQTISQMSMTGFDYGEDADSF